MTQSKTIRSVRAWLSGWRDCKRGRLPRVHTHPDYLTGYGDRYTFEAVLTGRTSK